jgi:hypothetical protein
MLNVVCMCVCVYVCMLGSEVTRWGGKTPELRATSSNQSGVLSFLKETSVHPNRCKNCLMRLIENQCISVSLAAPVLRLEMHAEYSDPETSRRGSASRAPQAHVVCLGNRLSAVLGECDAADLSGG